MKSRRRIALAWVVSLVLHGALVYWAVHLSPPPPRPSATPAIAVDLVWEDAVPPRPPDAVAAQLPTPQKSRLPRARPHASIPVPSPAPPDEAGSPPESEERLAAPTPPAVMPPAPIGDGAAASDALEPGASAEGQALSDAAPATAGAPSSAERDAAPAESAPGLLAEGPGLFPVIPGLTGSQANGYESQSAGRTLRNGEGEAPDTEALAAMNAEKARRKVQGFAIDALAAARVRPGLVDGYFGDMRKALQRTAQNPPKFSEGATFVHDLVEAWHSGATQWAKTGNPYAEGKQGEGSAERSAQDPLQQRAEARQGRGGSILDGANGGVEEEFLAKQQAAARLREFADGRFGSGIIALVEIRQRRDGGFVGAALVQSSGNRVFDQFVMETAPQAIAEVGPAPTQGQGVHKDGIRTVWSFEGRIVFKRKVDPKTLKAEDWAGILGQNALSSLTNGWFPAPTGNFDAVTGEMEIVDLTKPQFRVNVKLLRIY